MSVIKFKEEDRWLESDGQIMGRITKTPHKKGILLTLGMPWDENFEVVVEKVTGDSITEFCSMARGAYSERIEEQKAQKARAKFDAEMAADDARAEESVPAIKEEIQISLLDAEAVATRLVDIAGERLAYINRARELEATEILLTKILRVLEDAQEDNAEEIESPTRQEAQVKTYALFYGTEGEEE